MTLSLLKSILAIISLLITHAILAEGQSKAQTIYRCQIAGVGTFSDRPCGDSVEQYDAGLSRLSILDSPAAPPRTAERKPERAPRPQRNRTDNAEDTVQAKKAAACRHSQDSLHKISEQMRTGYSAKQGERLRTRKKDLEAKRRSLGC